jgi:hypothetical protein
MKKGRKGGELGGKKGGKKSMKTQWDHTSMVAVWTSSSQKEKVIISLKTQDTSKTIPSYK